MSFLLGLSIGIYIAWTNVMSQKIWLIILWVLGKGHEKVDMMAFIWMEWIRSQVTLQIIYYQTKSIFSSSIFCQMTF